LSEFATLQGQIRGQAGSFAVNIGNFIGNDPEVKRLLLRVRQKITAYARQRLQEYSKIRAFMLKPRIITSNLKKMDIPLLYWQT